MRKKIVKNNNQKSPFQIGEHIIGHDVAGNKREGIIVGTYKTSIGNWFYKLENGAVVYTRIRRVKNSTRTQIKQDEQRQVENLIERVKEFPYGMPIDQLTSAQRRFINRHKDIFENDNGYVKILPMDSVYRNPKRPRRIQGNYKRNSKSPEMFNADKLDELSGMFQGVIKENPSIENSLVKEYKRKGYAFIEIRKGVKGSGETVFVVQYATTNKPHNFFMENFNTLSEAQSWVKHALSGKRNSKSSNSEFKITEYDENAIGQPTVEVSDNEGNYWYFTKTKSGWGITFKSAKEGSNAEKIAMFKLVKQFERSSRYKQHYKKRNSKSSDIYNADKLDELSGMFQGVINGGEIQTYGSDYTPPITARLGKLTYIKIKNGTELFEGDFGKDAWLAMDARKNLYTEGRGARIRNVKLPPKGVLWHVGTVLQGNYVTTKRHIENGRKTEFYHELGEVDGICPNAFIDHDGFLILVGGNYDIGVHGIEN